MSNERNFEWNEIKQYAFDKIKWIVDHDNLLAYPDFSEILKMYTNAGDFQLR